MDGRNQQRPGHRAAASGRQGIRIAVAVLVTLAALAAITVVVVRLGHGAKTASPRGGVHVKESPTGGATSQPSHPASPSKTRGSKAGRRPSPSPTAPSGQAPAGSLAPASGALFGAWVAPTSGSTYSALETSILTFEHEIGRKLAIDQLYVPWGRPFPMSVVRWDLHQGSVPMISWAGTSTSQIAAGVYDSEFRASALELRSLHRPVMLRWFPEMDGSQYSPIVSSPASFVAAWRHVHDIFVRAGATNVIWVWCPNALHFGDGVAQRYYPGSSYVDWVGADGYNWAPTLRRAPWRDFASIFGDFYRWGLSAGKPMLIGEFGVLERRPGNKAAWYRQTDVELKTRFPAIKGLVYFNSDLDGFDWRITTSTASLAAFRSFATDPYFRAAPRV